MILPVTMILPLLALGAMDMSASSQTHVGPAGFLIHDGAPMFVIGAYAPPKGQSLKAAAEMGFNTMRVVGEPGQLDQCREAGLYGWVALDLNFSGREREARRENVHKSVESCRNHPSLLIWETVDEPAWSEAQPEEVMVPPEPLIEGYRYLRSLDRSHPVYLNHAPRNTIELLRRYNGTADILCVDVYPIIPPGLKKMYAIMEAKGPGGVPRQTDLPDLSPACVGDYVDKMKQVAFPSQPVFIALQGFAWEALRPVAEQDSSLILYPSLEQMRFMAWQSIIHGARGITIWGLSYNENQEYLAALSKVLREIRSLEPFILGHPLHSRPTLQYKARGYSIGKGIECLATETHEAVTLFAVNAAIDPASVEFSSLPDAFTGAEELDVLGEDRKVSLKDGKFWESFEGLEVHIYQVKKPGI